MTARSFAWDHLGASNRGRILRIQPRRTVIDFGLELAGTALVAVVFWAVGALRDRWIQQ